MIDNPQKPPVPRKALIILSVVLLAAFAFQILFSKYLPGQKAEFNGARALDDISYQLSLGPRIPGTAGHEKIVSWISNTLPSEGWEVEVQRGDLNNQHVENIIATKGSGSRWVILGAHYDTRQFADHDPDPAKHTLPVPGANDGASGVAVLMELSRILQVPADTRVSLVFFDTEDQGNIESHDWIMGSRYFADHLQGKPDAVVVLDMIGDADLNIYQEMNSDKILTAQIWQAAASLGYQKYFIADVKHSMLDDHTPFLQKGIPAVDIIDFDYPQWHTVSDDLEHVSAGSLQVVGDTIMAWLAAIK
jgi:glutaminyl-peptide cyclotransferase